MASSLSVCSVSISRKMGCGRFGRENDAGWVELEVVARWIENR